MMDFLRGLAPKRDADMQRAMPLLPSRFGGLRPLSLAPVADDAAGRASDASDAFLTASSRPSPAESSPQPERPRPRPGPPGAAVTVRVTETSVEEPQPAGVRSPVAATVTLAADRGLAPRMAASASERLAANVTPSGVEAREAGQSAFVVPGRQREAIPSSSRPLPATVLAARPSIQAEARPVFHVTIDRIEVRAPKPERPAPPARTRTAAPSLSLTDYLRRPRNPGGAV